MNVKRILAIKGKNVITIRPEQTLKEAAVLLTNHQIGALVVTDDHQKVVGILSERDIVRFAATHDHVLSLLVRDVMTPDVVTGVPQDDIHSIAHVMTEGRFRHLPIVVEERLVGIISMGDIIKAQRDTYRGEIDTLETQLLAEEEEE